MAAIKRTEAETLYNILDETIGVFRQENMSKGAERFYKKKRIEFIETYSNNIPASFWFQGVDCPSVSLDFDSAGFRLNIPSSPDVVTPSHKEIKIVEEANKVLHDFKFLLID